MIILNNVNKYFNRHKKNEIHVIDNITLKLEDTGLIALLGPSGSGKTTILNAIGGLDKIRSGQIYIDNKKISSKCTYKVDKIRNLNIGYIFQDYKLIDNLTVYENVALVLTMIGIKDKEEIKKRVEYVLDKVGMLRYRKRPAGMLSGGERQRVAIARAIVKDPDIILADEPTGNLDSKNSLEIMKIIKSISNDRLVILVTHEESLARFYASRIIELKDGKIVNDFKNNTKEELDYEIDNRFYLKDFKNKETLTSKYADINIYSESKEKMNLEIVIKNNNIYIKSKEDRKVEVIDEHSSIELVNEHYQKIKKEDIHQYNFDFKNIINSDFKKKYSSIYNIVTLMINGFKNVFHFSILKKLLLIGFFISAMFIMYCSSTISALFDIKEEDFISYDKNYLLVDLKKVKVDDYLSYETKEDINYILPGDSIINFSLKINDYYQTSHAQNTISGSLADVDMIKEKDLLYGRMPENDYEVIVDKLIIKKIFEKDNMLKMLGVTEVESLLDRTMNIQNMKDFKIVGISDTSNPSIYVSKNLFFDIIYNSVDSEDSLEKQIMNYSLFQDKIVLKKGRMPENDYETIVNISNKEEMPLNKEISTKVNDKKLKVVGYYDSKYNYNYYFTNLNTVKYSLIIEKEGITIYSKDKNKTIAEFRNLNLNIKDSYQYSKDKYKNERKENVKSTIIASFIVLAISLIEIFFMIRASFLSRIKEIGIYRAIGVKKKDIYSIFFGEIFAITTLSSIPGVLFMAYVLNTLSQMKVLKGMFLVNSNIILITIIFIFLFNLIIGLFPVFNVLRKRPAQILARHDLE